MVSSVLTNKYYFTIKKEVEESHEARKQQLEDIEILKKSPKETNDLRRLIGLNTLVVSLMLIHAEMTSFVVGVIWTCDFVFVGECKRLFGQVTYFGHNDVGWILVGDDMLNVLMLYRCN